MKAIRHTILTLLATTGMLSTTSHAQSKEIALAPNWMPDRRAMGEQSMKATAFYARAALEGVEPGKEIVPEKILSGRGWNLDWLMPLQEAEKRLPPGTRMQMGGATKLINATWPQNSIYVRSGQGKFYMPGVEYEMPPAVFTEIFLICDIKQQLIGVQFRGPGSQTGWNLQKVKNMPPMQAQPMRGPVPNGLGMGGRLKVETLNPYFDLLVMGANALGGRDVEYQVVRNRDNSDVVTPGMTCIHTHLNGSYLMNIRWYLAAPYARKLVEIAEMYEKATGKPLSK